MTASFKKRLKRLILLLLLGFIAMFAFRLAYGYTKTASSSNTQTQFFSDLSIGRKNYASKAYKKSVSSSHSAVKVDQKYEKVAQINTKSTKFDKEEEIARKQINKFNALIQFEQKQGNSGYRKLNLHIGVPPENFDSLYNNLVKIGRVQAKQITKKDKTNEYKELNAKKASLGKTLASLIELKSKGGKIEEYMGLENRILDIEQQLQDLGVSLGDFDDENEFCTVQFSLLEGQVVKISLMHRIKVALEWTIKFYLRLMTSLAFMAMFAYIVLLGIDKIKLVDIIGKKEDQS